MNKPIAMGNCVFATWEQLDVAFDEWAKGYFGEHVHAEAAREENDCCLEVEGLEHKDFEKFSALFERFDKEGLYDPEYEFETGAVVVQLPGEFARGILNEVFTGLRCVGSVQANDIGVFLMENELDYYKVMNGQYLADEHLDKGLVDRVEYGLNEDGLRSMIPIMQREGLTLAHVAEELDYRERAGVKDGSAGWNDNFYDYSTEELEFIEQAWGEMETGVLEKLVKDAEKLKSDQKIEGKDRDLGER